MDSRRIEERLRASLAARAAQIQAQDLRPVRVPASRGSPGPAWPQRFRLALAVPAVLVTVVGISLGVWSVGGQDVRRIPAESLGQAAAPATTPVTESSPPLVGATRQAPAPVESTVTPVTVSFTSRSATVSGTSTALTYPVARASGGDDGIAAKVQDILRKHVDTLIDAYSSQVNALAAPAGPPSLDITPATVARWETYLSVRFDETANANSTQPSMTSSAVVIDTTSGTAATAAQVFTDVDVADRLLRRAVSREAGGGADAGAIEALSMVPGPDGSTRPLAWYPAGDGLHWVVDQCAVAPCEVGQPTAVLPWNQLDNVLRPASGP